MSRSAIEAVLLRTRDGRLAAQVEDYCYLAVPAGERWRIAGAWRLAKPAETWEASDFYSWEGLVDDEDAFRAYVEDVAHHRRQLLDLPRPERHFSIGTPWGKPQVSYVYADGVVMHTTASHGGFKLSQARNAKIPDAFRNPQGWYEEDEEWAKVAIAFPDLFTDRERRYADQTIRNSWPDYWEAIHGRKLVPGESVTRDRQAFEQAHAEDWVVIAAIQSKTHAGMIECSAALGGRRGESRYRMFLVPSGEYVAGPFGFVIDEARHREI